MARVSLFFGPPLQVGFIEWRLRQGFWIWNFFFKVDSILCWNWIIAQIIESSLICQYFSGRSDISPDKCHSYKCVDWETRLCDWKTQKQVCLYAERLPTLLFLRWKINAHKFQPILYVYYYGVTQKFLIKMRLFRCQTAEIHYGALIIC